jgi:hypothetical protein
MAGKRFAPQVPLAILLPATLLLDILVCAFGYVGIESAEKGIPWSHGLFMSVCWSAVVAFLVQRISRSLRAGMVVGLMVFSHWVLDFISHPIPYSSFSYRTWRWDYGHPLPSDLPLLFHGSPVVGLGLYNSISAVQATVLEVGMFLLGTAVYVDYLVRGKKKRATDPA